MKNDSAYIKITEEVEEDSYTPTEDELMLDNYTDEEYTTPYTDNYDDVFDVGGIIEAGGIFDDR